MNQEQCWRAVESRDPNADGRFYFGVLTTGIFCRPSCPARRPLRKNVRFYATPQDAEREGLRPCLRCKPTETQPDRISELRRYIEAHSDEPLTLEDLAARAKLSRFYLQRTFKAAVGMTPKEYQESFRTARLKKGLRKARGVVDAVYDAGFGSGSRVYEHADSRLGMTPGQYRHGGRGVQIRYATVDSPLGLMMIGATDRGICFLQFGDSAKELAAELRREFPAAEIRETSERHTEEFRRWEAEIRRFLTYRAAAPGTDFQMRVWNYLQTIPPGETRSYGDVAKGIGKPDAVRAVAQACATNRVAILIPCHRVIRGDGELGGYRWGIERKRRLLAQERASMSAG